jgi:hypothetical protein
MLGSRDVDGSALEGVSQARGLFVPRPPNEFTVRLKEYRVAMR